MLTALVGGALGGVVIALLNRPRRRDPDWLRELRARRKLQKQLEPDLSPEARQVLARIMWDKYR
jgi:hypothetical protein